MQSVQSNSAAQTAAAAGVGRSAAGGQAQQVASPAAHVVSAAPQASANAEASASAPAINPAEMAARIERVAEQMREMAKQNNRDLAFDVDKQVNRFVIRVTNPTSGELIRQIPSEDILRIAHRIDSMKGLIFEDLF